MSDLINSLLHDNPYFTAGFGLLGVGAALAGLRQGASRAIYLLQRRYLTTIEVTSKDPSYGWIINWLTRQALTSGNHFTINTRTGRSGNKGNEVSLSPSPGVHYLRCNGSWIKVKREREKTALMDISTGVPFETITLSTIGRRAEYFKQIIKEAQRRMAEEEHGKLVIYTSWAAEWRPFGNPRRQRTLDSVVFEEGVKEGIVEDVKEFLSSGKWYLDRGIPYRRGYLLYGPPGGGKSSFIQALASELNYSICLLNLGDPMLTDDRLNHLLNVVPDCSILLLEDIDSAMPIQGKNDGSNHTRSKLTFSGLLNALDGVASSEERLIFMTTNNYDCLDHALIRPGRVDYQQYIGKATRDQIRKMFERFYPQHGHLAERFAERAASLDLSPADIQGHFIHYKTTPLAALQSLDQIK